MEFPYSDCLVATTVAVTVATADLIRGQLGQKAHAKAGQIVGHVNPLGLVNLQARTIQAHESSCADPAHDNGVYQYSTERFEWTAGSVSMVQVTIGDFGQLAGFSIDHNEHGSRTEVPINQTV